MTKFYHVRRMILASHTPRSGCFGNLPDDLLDVIDAFLSEWELYF